MSNPNQTESTSLAKNPVAIIRQFVSDPGVKSRLSEMLGKRAGSFANSIINLVKGNETIQKCTPDSIMSSAMISASINLPIDPALGYAAIVPYRQKNGPFIAQFQLMYRGVIQLCIRSGQYARIHNTEVYADEIKYYNPLTGDVEFNNPSTFKMRYTVVADGVIDPKNVVGVYTYFRLNSGFECFGYMSKEQLIAHGKRFSKSYQYDLKEGKKTSLWSLDPVSMFKKTGIKLLLWKYGIMSIEMQDAFIEESKDFTDAAIDADKTIADEAGSQVIDAGFETNQSPPADNQQQQGQDGAPNWL